MRKARNENLLWRLNGKTIRDGWALRGNEGKMKSYTADYEVNFTKSLVACFVYVAA